MRYLLIAFALILAACGGASAVSPDDVLAKFKAAGLEAEQAHPMTPDEYGVAPLLCQDGARRFLIPSLGDDSGGRLFVCKAEADTTNLKAFYDELGRQSAMFHSWTYQKGGVVLQLNGELEQATAEKYGNVIAGL